LIEGLPAPTENAARILKRGADGRLYVSIAAGCNACAPSDELSGTIAVLGDNGKLAVLARGLRQAEGFDWLPATQTLYALDIGREGLGDVIPPDELDLILPGEHYGWPFRYGLNVKDPEWGERMPALLDPVMPAYVFDAHSAPLAIRILQHSDDPELKTAALVTKHGSQDPEVPAGFEIVSLHWHDDGRIEEEKFMTGCLKDKRILCQPVDLIEAQDGTLFVSDDFTGAIYRLTFAR
jgi:glucose/arabinose dehydrogenase